LGIEKLKTMGFPLMMHAQSVIKTLEPNQCLYIPAGWWYQIETEPSDTTTVVTFWYDMASSWLQMLFEGIQNDKL
jgi:hypothetical protein